MTKSELKNIIREMLKEELEESGTLLKEDEQKTLHGYVVKAWDTPDKNGAGMIDTSKKGIAYATFDELIKALQTSELDEKGAYEITWVK